MKTPSRPCWRRVISCCHANLNSTKSPAVSVFFGVMLFLYIYIITGGHTLSAVAEWKIMEAHIYRVNSVEFSLLFTLLAGLVSSAPSKKVKCDQSNNKA